jgi:hypothetical protein
MSASPTEVCFRYKGTVGVHVGGGGDGGEVITGMSVCGAGDAGAVSMPRCLLSMPMDMARSFEEAVAGEAQALIDGVQRSLLRLRLPRFHLRSGNSTFLPHCARFQCGR